MIGLQLKHAKGLFFDRQAVQDAVSRSERKVLSKFGAFVRQTAKTSIRKRKGAAPAGRPPHSHVGLLKRHIYFVFSPETRSVVIGPVLLNQKSDALWLLEHGGTVERERKSQQVRMTYRPRPFMAPAFEKEHEKLPALWRDSVK